MDQFDYKIIGVDTMSIEFFIAGFIPGFCFGCFVMMRIFRFWEEKEIAELGTREERRKRYGKSRIKLHNP